MPTSEEMAQVAIDEFERTRKKLLEAIADT
jgi:hypothetical protein